MYFPTFVKHLLCARGLDMKEPEKAGRGDLCSSGNGNNPVERPQLLLCARTHSGRLLED